MMSLTEIDDLITWPDKSADAEHPHRPGAQGSSPNAPNALKTPKTSNASVARVAPVPGPGLRLTRVGKRFGDREVLKGIDLHIPPGEFVAIVGRSGCGKSTLLRLLAGLETLSGGTLQGGDVAATRFMFQDARLLPWARVAANVALGLPKEDAEPRAREALGQVGLADRANDWPARLSGGQRQRVALARALVRAPEFLLLDEPLGALDALTRIDMQRLIETIWLRHGFTALLVTHDVAEAVALADRVLLIEDGQVALDLRVDLPRPRVRDAAFAALEQRLLDRVLQNGQGGEAEEASPLSLPAPALRWAV